MGELLSTTTSQRKEKKKEKGSLLSSLARKTRNSLACCVHTLLSEKKRRKRGDERQENEKKRPGEKVKKELSCFTFFFFFCLFLYLSSYLPFFSFPQLFPWTQPRKTPFWKKENLKSPPFLSSFSAKLRWSITASSSAAVEHFPSPKAPPWLADLSVCLSSSTDSLLLLERNKKASSFLRWQAGCSGLSMRELRKSEKKKWQVSRKVFL